jgi:hypothetical protein
MARHCYSPAAADEFTDELYDLARQLDAQERSGERLPYFGVASHTSLGRARSEAQLQVSLCQGHSRNPGQ